MRSRTGVFAMREGAEAVGGVQPLVEIINRSDATIEKALLEMDTLLTRDQGTAQQALARGGWSEPLFLGENFGLDWLRRAVVAKKYIGALECIVDRVRLVVPWHQRRSSAEGVGQAIAHHVPISGTEAHVVAHGFPFDDLVGIVVFECKGVFRRRAFVADMRNIGKVCHGG
jgi:hypothetical protein